MTFYQILLPLLLSAFTGWLAIWICIKLLFRPYKPINIAGINIQGALPAQQKAIAEKIARLVSSEIVSVEGLTQKAMDPENFNRLKPEIETHINGFLRERLKDTFPMLAMLIGDKTINQLKTAFMTELESLFPVLMKSYLGNLEKEFDIENLVFQKIAGFPLQKAEDLFYKSGKKLLIKVQLLGTITGLLIGLIHLLLNAQLFS